MQFKEWIGVSVIAAVRHYPDCFLLNFNYFLTVFCVRQVIIEEQYVK
jgi:hypothetical protein